MDTKFWDTPKLPHPASLTNLRKIADFCTANNFVSPANTISAYAVSRETGIAYTQVLNLLKKPGFVQVKESPTDRATFFYAFAQLGMQYPDKFPPNVRLPRLIISSPAVTPTTGNTEVDAEVARVNSHTQPQMDFSTANIPTGTRKKPVLAQAWNAVFEQGVLGKTRTPEQIAGFAYKLAEAIKNGTITLED